MVMTIIMVVIICIKMIRYLWFFILNLQDNLHLLSSLFFECFQDAHSLIEPWPSQASVCLIEAFFIRWRLFIFSSMPDIFAPILLFTSRQAVLGSKVRIRIVRISSSYKLNMRLVLYFRNLFFFSFFLQVSDNEQLPRALLESSCYLTWTYIYIFLVFCKRVLYLWYQ